MVITQEIHLSTRGHCDIQDVTSQVAQAVKDSGLIGITATTCAGGTTTATPTSAPP